MRRPLRQGPWLRACRINRRRSLRTVVAAAFAAAGLLALALLRPPGADAQQVRGWTQTTVNFADMRPLVRVAVDPAELEVDGDGRSTLDGRPVQCIPGQECVIYRPSEVEGAAAGMQDVGLTAWGLGVRGLSFTTLLRARTGLGSDLVWPRSEDAFDALLGYLELERGAVRARLGRQETLSGLGFSGFDGASLAWTPRSDLQLEAYGGRSLARALAEPRHEALRGLEDFVLDRNAWLVGAFVQGRLPARTEVGLRYQREIWSDRSGLISERASLDVTSEALRPVRLRGSVDWDVAFNRIGKARLEVQRAIPAADLLVSVQGRRYVPYFELSTVWGYFSPVAYHELLLRTAWGRDALGLWVEGGWRTYEETHAPVIFDPLDGERWRARAGGTWQTAPAWAVDARYELEWGVGAFLSAADAAVRFSPGDAVDIALHGSTFQRFQEFRVGEGRVFGGGVSLGYQFTDRVRLDGGGAVYRHDSDVDREASVWNQVRAWTALRFEFGEDPARPRVRLRR